MNYPKLNPNSFIPNWVLQARKKKEKELIPHPQNTKKKEATK